MKIGLIGDYIEDVYIYGKCERISPESPIPIFEQQRVEYRDGGAGNVKNNMETLGAKVTCYTSFHSTKKRYVVDNHILFRCDQEDYVASRKTKFYFEDDVEWVVISDYNKGYIHNAPEIIKDLKSKGKKVIVDPKKPLTAYVGADIIKMNESEFQKYAHITDEEELRQNLNVRTLIITRGRKGVLVIDKYQRFEIKPEDHEVSDVTGAGDIFIAALAYYLSSKFDLETSVRRATKLASLSVTKFGTYTLTKEDIAKVSPKIIFTNGCFDILHRGHIEYLRKSKELGDKLIVGLNSDASVRKLKGSSRPINNQEDRKMVLENLGFVDEVIVFDEETPYELIKKVKPDIITKGGDYTVETTVGNDLAEVVIIPKVEGYSTTKVLELL